MAYLWIFHLIRGRWQCSEPYTVQCFIQMPPVNKLMCHRSCTQPSATPGGQKHLSTKCCHHLVFPHPLCQDFSIGALIHQGKGRKKPPLTGILVLEQPGYWQNCALPQLYLGLTEAFDKWFHITVRTNKIDNDHPLHPRPSKFRSSNCL